jgi:predicted DNA-binding protein with PD1-like motif
MEMSEATLRVERIFNNKVRWFSSRAAQASMKILHLGKLAAVGAGFLGAGWQTVRSTPAAEPVVRWLTPAEATPYGTAPGAQSRLLATHPDGARDFALILKRGDETATALAEFADRESIVAARFTAIGAARDIEVGWFDQQRKQYKAMRQNKQVELLTLTGDIGTAQSGEPLVHAHLVVGLSDGVAWGGHLLHAVASPTVEVFLTAYPDPLPKRLDAETDLQLFDLSPRG